MRVVKFGGSLLDNPDWPSRLRNWLNQQPAAAIALLVGGGAAVDDLRKADRRFGLGESAAHWLAIRCMQLQAELVAALLPEARIVLRLEEMDRLRSSRGWFLVDPWHVLKDESRLSDLPHSWSVTSDSIAARLAVEWNASELTLLKSCLPREPATIASAAATSYVDAYFPQAVKDFPGTIRCVHLRATPATDRLLFRERQLAAGDAPHANRGER